MSGTRRQVCLNLTELEISTIQALFSHSEWDFDSCVVFNNWSESNTDEVIRSCTNQEITAVCSTSANFPGQDEEQLAVEGNPGHGDENETQQINERECMYCFCHPCVTTNRQIWLGNGSPPHARNSAIRKTKYKKFWTMMSVRCAWNHPRYIAKKAEKLNQGDSENIVWTLRELMPECVLSLVRNLYPNPSGRPYMGHKWS